MADEATTAGTGVDTGTEGKVATVKVKKAAPKTAPKAGGGANSEGKVRKPRAPRGPSLNWTGDMDLALAEALKDPDLSTYSDIAEFLTDHEAFEGVSDVLNAQKVHYRVNLIRRQGAKVPSRRGNTRRKADIEAINEVLTGG